MKNAHLIDAQKADGAPNCQRPGAGRIVGGPRYNGMTDGPIRLTGATHFCHPGEVKPGYLLAMAYLSIFCLSLFLGLIACSTASATDIYGYVDEDGVQHFSNVPDPLQPKYQLVLRTAEAASPTTVMPRRAGSGSLPGSARSHSYQKAIWREAQANQLDPLLVEAVIAVESDHNPDALSPAGAAGLMQLMPATAKRYGVDNPYHPESNIRGGTRYLHDLISMFNGNLSLALAAYNAGENAVIRYGRKIPPFAETRIYVPRVLQRYSTLKTRN